MHEEARSRQALLLTAALFSTGGVAIKAVGMTGGQVACWRSAIAAVALWFFLPRARRGWDLRVWLLGVAYASTLVLFVLANRLTTGANAIFLEDSAPLYVAILGAVFLGERPKLVDLWFALPFIAGIALFFADAQRAVVTATNPPLGNLLAALSAISFAIVIVGFRALGRVGEGDGSMAVVLVGNGLAFAMALPLALPLARGRVMDWALLAYLGIVQIGLAYVLMTYAMRRVRAVEASLLLLLEPVLNPIWTWMAFGERPGSLAILGGVLILGATAVRSWRSG